jgi:RNA polymerase sigma-B factor
LAGSRPETLDEAGAEELLREYARTKAPATRDRLIAYHSPLVRWAAQRFLSTGEPLDDLVQEGTVGLIRAVDLYDPARATKFSTYASHLIQGHIHHYLRDRARIIREPAWVQEVYSRLTKAVEALTTELGRAPTTAQIADHMDLTLDAVEELMQFRHRRHVLSLDSTLGDEDGVPLLDRDKIRSSRHRTLRLPIEDRIVIEEAIGRLKEIERKVVHLFFYQDLSRTEIAKRLGISISYSSSVLKRAVKKLRAEVSEEPAPTDDE